MSCIKEEKAIEANVKPNWFELHPKKALLAILCTIFIFFVFIDFLLAHFFLVPSFVIPNYYYDHDLKSNKKHYGNWGEIRYTFFTNSLGFKDSAIRKVDLQNDKYRIIFLGDSFTEGVGYSYDQTFVGIFAKFLGNEKYEVLNAGVVSYYPKLYYLKLKYLLEDIGLKVNEVIIFIDISDIQDEFANQNKRPYYTYYIRWLRAFFRQNSFSFYQYIELKSSLGHSYNKAMVKLGLRKEKIVDRDLWTLDQKTFDSWGRKGLKLCDQSMEKLYQLCLKHHLKLTIAVYPWSRQILNRDLYPIQVTHWRNFAKKRNIGFINYFPHFIDKEDVNLMISQNFIPSDDHWNETGHKLVANILIDYWNINNKSASRKLDLPR
jgi:hypothetical protein